MTVEQHEGDVMVAKTIRKLIATKANREHLQRLFMVDPSLPKEHASLLEALKQAEAARRSGPR